MGTKPAYLGKTLISTICLLLLISVGVNIYQYTAKVSERNSRLEKSRNFISNQEAAFSNVFSVAGRTNILEYIKTPDNLSAIIEGIQTADGYYLTATKLAAENQLSGGVLLSRNLISGYLSELRSYRTFLQHNSGGSYEDINEIAIDMEDLQTISSWLERKYKNKDFEVYTDVDFFTEVYATLKSDIKRHYFIGFDT